MANPQGEATHMDLHEFQAKELLDRLDRLFHIDPLDQRAALRGLRRNDPAAQ